MALLLDDNQQKIVDTKRKPASARPQYYDAATGKQTTISADFEAFLILQGRQNNSNTVKWLDQSSHFGIRDFNRDALGTQALQNDVTDAENSQLELSVLIDLFTRFRQNYNMSGFENVVEAGLLLQDLQRPMQELQTLVNRLKHRVQFGAIATKALTNNGVTPNEQKQIDSWYSPLSAY